MTHLATGKIEEPMLYFTKRSVKLKTITIKIIES